MNNSRDVEWQLSRAGYARTKQVWLFREGQAALALFFSFISFGKMR